MAILNWDAVPTNELLTRGGGGRAKLDVSPIAYGWGDLADTLKANPGNVYRLTRDMFRGVDDEGNEVVPSIATIGKAIRAQLWTHGVVAKLSGEPTGETKTTKSGTEAKVMSRDVFRLTVDKRAAEKVLAISRRKLAQGKSSYWEGFTLAEFGTLGN